MLTDMKLPALKPAEKLYKLVDRDGLYVAVLPSGAVSFRFNCRLNGRRETLTLGVYGPTGLSLAEARGRVVEGCRLLTSGVSPAAETRRAMPEDRSGGASRPSLQMPVLRSCLNSRGTDRAFG